MEATDQESLDEERQVERHRQTKEEMQGLEEYETELEARRVEYETRCVEYETRPRFIEQEQIDEAPERSDMLDQGMVFEI